MLHLPRVACRAASLVFLLVVIPSLIPVVIPNGDGIAEANDAHPTVTHEVRRPVRSQLLRPSSTAEYILDRVTVDYMSDGSVDIYDGRPQNHPLACVSYSIEYDLRAGTYSTSLEETPPPAEPDPVAVGATRYRVIEKIIRKSDNSVLARLVQWVDWNYTSSRGWYYPKWKTRCEPILSTTVDDCSDNDPRVTPGVYYAGDNSTLVFYANATFDVLKSGKIVKDKIYLGQGILIGNATNEHCPEPSRTISPSTDSTLYRFTLYCGP